MKLKSATKSFFIAAAIALICGVAWLFSGPLPTSNADHEGDEWQKAYAEADAKYRGTLEAAQ